MVFLGIFPKQRGGESRIPKLYVKFWWPLFLAGSDQPLCKISALPVMPFMFLGDKYHFFDKYLTEIFFPESLGSFLPVPTSFGWFPSKLSKIWAFTFVILEILNAMDRLIVQCILCMQLDDRDIMLKHKCVQVHRADSHEPYGWKGQVEILKISPFFFSFVGKKNTIDQV